MADEPSSSAAKKLETKGGSKRKRVLGWLKLPKSANPPASQLNSTLVSVSSAPDAQGPGPGNDAESAEPTASGSNGTSHQDPSAALLSARSPSSVPDLLGSAVGPGHGRETSRTSTHTAEPASMNPQTQVLDSAKEGLGVASRFAQTLLKKLPGCVDTNPVKMALSIVKTIIEIKDAVGDNKDELAQLLEATANRLQAVERTVDISVPKAAEQAMEKLEQILQEQMKKLEDLAGKSLVTQTLDYEEYKKTMRQIFQHINEASTSFQVTMAKSIQNTASQIHDDIKKAALERLRPSEKADHKTVLEVQTLKREECTAGTRVKILDDITKWANDPSSDSPRVFWLTGQAGSGKTTIAYTIAKRFEKDGGADQHAILGGNFLCSRQFEETQQQTRIVPTIAYQLARKCISYANALHVADKFDAVNHDISSQLKGLLVVPWLQSEATRPQELPPYLIVIDALDEIKGNGGSAFLRDLLTAINKYNLRSFRFLVTSRPDPKVVTLCESFASKAICRLQDVPIEEAKSDIEAYLNIKLPMLANSPKLSELGRRAGGLFIYAATVVNYLTPFDSITGREQTGLLEDFLSKSYEPALARDATFLIDDLYQKIMCDAFSKVKGKLLASRLHILYTFLCTAERASAHIVAALVSDSDYEAATAVLRDLHAVLYTQDGRVFWYHASFPDFIFDPARSNFCLGGKDFAFSCDEPVHHNLLGESCFRVMKTKSGLRFNMGDITSSFLFDRDNTAVLSEKVNQNINAVLRYSCCHWAHHLSSPQSIDTDNLRRCISDFLQIRVLFWIEAMNLLGLSNQCTPMLQRARQWVLECGNSYSELARDVGEAANFATYFTGSPAAESTPHLYSSALATWSQDTSLCRNWKKQFSRIPGFTHTKVSHVPLMTIQTGSPSWAVAFSSDGTRIVSGSYNSSVRVWDASTGMQVQVLKGHTDEVRSVALSRDGTRIVSGSIDKSVRVWDASKGVQVQVMKGHIGRVNSVAFSSDGMWIVSGSGDESVRVWGVSKGVQLKKLNGHTSGVTAVAFSNNDKQIVSGSFDKSVRVWDACTGGQLQVLDGHNHWVNSVAFSSDDTRIVSGSYDRSVRVWNASTGVQLVVLKGHTDDVSSVAFSSDGTQIVSGSYDQSVRVWDASTGVQREVLKGHTGGVNSVVFSSDSTRIVSGSGDESVRVWDAPKGVQLEVLKGHTYEVTAVAFSSDGTQIISGSDDNSVRVWDASKGVQLKELKGHIGRVNSVAFSSDGMWIVSGSGDESVRVWDASKGAQLKVLKGHTYGVTAVAFSNNGKQIVSGSFDKSVRVWDACTGGQLKVLDGHNHWVHSVAFSSDNTRIVSGSGDMSVRVWDAPKGVQLDVLEGHDYAVTAVAFSSDGTQIVSGSYDKSVRVWDASTGVQREVLEGHTGRVNSVMFSSDSTRIVSGSFDGTVRVWDVSTGVQVQVMEGHTHKVSSVAFSSDGTRIVSGSFDGTVRVWGISGPAEFDDSNHVSTIGYEYLPWRLTPRNWIISSSGDHLMWVPPVPLVALLAPPFNILVISPHGSAAFDFRQSMIGVDWVGCYTP